MCLSVQRLLEYSQGWAEIDLNWQIIIRDRLASERRYHEAAAWMHAPVHEIHWRDGQKRRLWTAADEFARLFEFWIEGHVTSEELRNARDYLVRVFHEVESYGWRN